VWVWLLDFQLEGGLIKAGQLGRHPNCCAANAASKTLNSFPLSHIFKAFLHFG